MSVAIVQSGITPARTGCNDAESVLTSEAVQAQGIKVLWKCYLPGDYRGSEHQPLVVPSVLQSDGTTCGVMICASMSDDIFCFDDDKPDPVTGNGRVIWQRRIGNPGLTTTNYDMYMINVPFWGSLSCPYVDTNTNTVYVCCGSTPDGNIAHISYYLHALDLQDGSDKAPPLNISTAVYQSLGGAIAHNASPRKQRSGLAFFSYAGAHDTIFIADSTFAMMANAAHGFIVACDVTGIRAGGAMAIAASWTASAPPYAGAGVWMAGQAPAVSATGELFVAMANGAFDPTKGCYGNAVVRLVYTPATATVAASLKAVDQFAAYSDAGRSGFDPTIPWIGLVPNYGTNTDPVDMGGVGWDEDLGSAGVVLLETSLTGFTTDLVCACGKDGISYGLYANNLGGTLIGDFAPSSIQANYAKAAWITGATYYPDQYGVDITPTDLGTFTVMPGGFCRHQHATPPVYVSPDHGVLMFFGGENGPVRAFQVAEPSAGKFTITYVGEGADIASPGMAMPGGMPGTFAALSCDGQGTNTGVLWALQPLGDANVRVVPGRLIAYGANWFDNGTLIKLWDSQDWGWQFSYSKFGRASPVGGKLRMPTYDACVWVLGLA